MKVKSIIAYGLLLLGVGAATTSCEDTFTADNNLVSTNLAPQDTLYQVMGIVKRMQKIADRTVLLGEIRADLLDVNPTIASTDIQQLYNNNISADNVYNNPRDYYAVINNCNIYLANVDAGLKTHGEYYYEKEICAVKSYRAWCYLELAKIYGSVPLITEPVLTADDAEDIILSGNKADMGTILDFCINDLKDYAYKDENLALRPAYGAGASWNGISYANFFIPVRALLGELYLWKASSLGKSDAAKAEYINAIRMYHDYLCFPNEERGTTNNYTRWLDVAHTRPSSGYSSARFGVDNTFENAAVLPCDTNSYYGNTSELRVVFNSLYANNYYSAVVPSQRIRKISADQVNFYYDKTKSSDPITFFTSDPNDYDDPLQVGDLRLYDVYQTESNLAESKYNANVSPTKSWFTKWNDGNSRLVRSDKKNAYIPFYRNSIIYLHMAEALNRAGFPETAFAVLKYGLTYNVMNDSISKNEFNELCNIKSYGFFLAEPKYNGALAAQANNSFVIWPSNKFENPNNKSTAYSPTAGTISQIGIHSYGSGPAELNPKYALPVDSVGDPSDTRPTYKQMVDAGTYDATNPNLCKGIVPVPDTLKAPAIMADPGAMLTLEEYCTQEGLDPTKAASKSKYNGYTKQWQKDYDAYTAWSISYPVDYAAYQASLVPYTKAVAHNAVHLASSYVVTKRQGDCADIILDEEALEGMFEGLRFYDLMRYQMQEGKISGPNATITMPDYITTKYGASQRDGMIGRPWFLTLPTR